MRQFAFSKTGSLTFLVTLRMLKWKILKESVEESKAFKGGKFNARSHLKILQLRINNIIICHSEC